MTTLPAWVLKSAVKDCDSIEEFLDKYYKHERYRGRGKEYADALLSGSKEHVGQYGYDLISRHDNVSGRTVTYIP